MVGILDLPSELILHILWFLSLTDVISAQLSHRSLYGIIKGSVLLKYLAALKAAGMEDNRLCLVGSMSERLKMLNRRENAWASNQVDFSRKIPIPADIKPEFFCGLNGATCFFRGPSNLSLHYFRLPSNISDEIRWSCIDIDTVIISIGLAIHEHDLIAIATQLHIGLQMFDILIFEASTGNPHPLAQNRRISIARPPHIDIKIAGDHLAIVTTFYGYKFGDYIDIYDWKTGVLKIAITAPGTTYADCLFLSPNILLLPNMQDNTFEFWHIPELPGADSKTCPSSALGLPPVDCDSSITHFTCKCDSPFGIYGVPHTLPFHSSAADAIAVFNLAFQPPQVRAPISRSIMFVHLRSLLNICSLSSVSPPMPEGSPAKVDVIPWDKWGPPVTRLLRGSTSLLNTYSASACQRYAFPSEDEGIIVLDFNPIRIQHHKQGDAPNSSVKITSESRSNDIWFEKPVTSRLPYIWRIFQNTGPFDKVAIDDEWLIGFPYTDNDSIELEVLHIGQAASV